MLGLARPTPPRPATRRVRPAQCPSTLIRKESKKKKCKNEEWPAAQIYGCNCIEGGRSATIMVILSFEQNRAEKLHERCYRDAPTLFLGPWHEIYGRTISFRPEKSLGEEGMVQLNLSGHASR